MELFILYLISFKLLSEYPRMNSVKSLLPRIFQLKFLKNPKKQTKLVDKYIQSVVPLNPIH